MKRSRNRWPAIVVSLAFALAPAARATLVFAEETGPFAQQRYERGLQLYDQKKWSDALVEFRASYALLASPNSRLFIARCLRELGRLDEAAIEYEETAREATARAETDARYVATRDAAKSELASLQPKIGYVVVKANDLPAEAKVKVGARVLPAAAIGLPVPVMPGNVVVALDAPDHETSEKQVQIAPGERKEISIALGAAKTAATTTTTETPLVTTNTSSTQKTAGAITIVVGAVGVTGFVVFGVLAKNQYDSLQSECGGGPCTADRSDEISAGRRWQTMANVSLAVGAVGIVTGSILMLSAPSKTSEPTVAVGVGPGTLSLQGSF